MSKAFTDFGLLLADIWGDPAKTMVIRSATDSDSQLELFLGADAAGRRHILAPIGEDYAFAEFKRESLELQEWRHPETGLRFLDLQCNSEQLVKTFCTLADHVIDRVNSDGEQPHLALQAALKEFQTLLKPARELTEEAARGLFGELYMLRMFAARNPIYAPEVWVGPRGELHDFRAPQGDIEVKTSSAEGATVSISSLNQLDRVAEVPLVLVRVRVDSSPSGQNLADLVNELVAMGCLRAALLERLEEAGFRLGVDVDFHRFTVTEPPLGWLVDDHFPGLRSTDLPEERRDAITHIKYTLDLVNAPGRLSPDELDAFVTEMMVL